MNITVFCSSSDRIEAVFVELARELGTRLGDRGDTLIYGGGSCGLMGEVARAAKAAGSPSVVGVYPKYFDHLAEPVCDEHIRTEGLRDRMTIMEERADAFIALPGGIGTVHEIFDQLAPQSLKLHRKPVVLISPGGFYDHLLAFLDQLVEAGFMREEHRQLYRAVGTVDEALKTLDELWDVT